MGHAASPSRAGAKPSSQARSGGMRVAVWMVLLQVIWVLLALRHRRRDPRDGSVPVVTLTGALQGVLLSLARFLFFLDLPGLRPAPSSPPWLNPSIGEAPPAGFELQFDGLAASAEGLGGGRWWAKVGVILSLLVLGVAPLMVMILAARGALIGDPTGLPDALAAFGAYCVSVGAVASGRLHTRTSLVWVTLVPLSALLVCGAWIMGTLSGPVPPEGAASNIPQA